MRISCFFSLLLCLSSCDASGTLEIRLRSPSDADAALCLGNACKLVDARLPLKADKRSSLEYSLMGGDWQGSFKFSLEIAKAAKDKENNFFTASWTASTLSGKKWVTLLENPLEVSFRFLCKENFYGKECMRFCLPTDNQLGHFTCSEEGDRICHQGWTGIRCNEAVCSSSCGNGTCVAPDVCQCGFGFTGPKCDVCTSGKRCKHGKCFNNIPGTCACDDGWTGPNCDIDRIFCSRHSPCRNGGKCLNGMRSRRQGASPYTCVCPKGYAGKQCEKKTTDICEGADGHVCLNGGSCIATSNGTRCECPTGFEGTMCQTALNSRSSVLPLNPNRRVHPCVSFGCRNEGSCHLEDGLPKCMCPPCFSGSRCETSTCADNSTVIADSRSSSEYTFDRELVFAAVSLLVIVYKVITMRSQQNQINGALECNAHPSESSESYKICIDESMTSDGPPSYAAAVGDEPFPQKKDVLVTTNHTMDSKGKN